MSFDTTKTSLKDLLGHIETGKIQLPDFQRDYVWNEDDVRSLLASIAKGFPVGALLTLDRGGSVEFKPRGIEGTSVEGIEPETLLLDGQQRMTSLFKTVLSKQPARVRTPKASLVDRFFYIDVEMALDPQANFEDAIQTVPEDRIAKTSFGKAGDLDLSSVEREYERLMFPLNQALEPTTWIFGCVGHWKSAGHDRMADLLQFQDAVLKRIQNYQMPVIRLSKDNSREAVCTVFEKVNVGGKKLDAFELVTAIYAASGFDLREDWAGTKGAHGRLGRLRAKQPPKGVFSDLASTDFLQACTILHTREKRLAAEADGKAGKELPPINCSREALLALPKDAYVQYAPLVEGGFTEAARFLNEQKILWGRDLPYPTQLVAMAAFFALLPKPSRNAATAGKLERWYWSGVLGEFYGSATETKIARDVPDLLAWVDGGPLPRTMADTFFQVDRLDTLRMRLSAAYKGFHALLMRSGCRDFLTGKGVEVMTVYSDALDIHHIFPRKWCEANGIKPGIYNSIVNKTALSADTNRIIGGDAPSIYLAKIEAKLAKSDNAATPGAMLDDILRSHLIDPELLRADDFAGFYAARKAALASLAGNAQGKDVIQEALAEGAVADEDVTMDEEESMDEAA